MEFTDSSGTSPTIQGLFKTVCTLFNKTIIPLVLVRYEMIRANSASHFQRTLVEWLLNNNKDDDDDDDEDNDNNTCLLHCVLEMGIFQTLQEM